MHFASTATGEKRVRVLLGLYGRGKIGRDVLDAEGIDPAAPLPPLTTRMTTFAGAVGRVVRQAATGGQVVAPREVVDARKDACRGCIARQEKVCRECGCVLSAKQKWLTETCPLGKWPNPPDSPRP